MRDTPYTLGDAHDDGGLVLVRCGCRRRQHYLPGDIIAVFGNLTVRELPSIERKMRCTGCGDSDGIAVKIVHPSAAERAGIRLRRLIEIRTVRRPIWKDEV